MLKNIISIDPNELKDLILQSNNVWNALSDDMSILDEESPVINFAYASVTTIKNIKKNEKFGLDNIWVKRPGNGKILSKDFYKVLGQTAKRDLTEGKQLEPDDVLNFK